MGTTFQLPSSSSPVFCGVKNPLSTRLTPHRCETIAGIFQTSTMIPPSKRRYHTMSARIRVFLKMRRRSRFNFNVTATTCTVLRKRSAETLRLGDKCEFRFAIKPGDDRECLLTRLSIFRHISNLWREISIQRCIPRARCRIRTGAVDHQAVKK